MKTKYTFEELAKIFAQVTRVEATAAAFETAHNAYVDAEDAFDDAYDKNGYTFIGAAGDNLRQLFDKKMALSKERNAACRRAYNAIKDFGKMIDIDDDRNGSDIVADCVKQYLDRKWYWRTTEQVNRVKYLAVWTSGKVDFKY